MENYITIIDISIILHIIKNYIFEAVPQSNTNDVHHFLHDFPQSEQ